jgi:hypothetical protein
MTSKAETGQGGRPSGGALGLALALLLTAFAVAPLTYPGFYQARSGFLPAFRAAGLEIATNGDSSGHPPDSLQAEGPLPYLLAQPFLALSGSGVTAIKWGYGLGILLGLAGAYAWGRRRLGNRGGVLVAVIYTYLPWHLSTVYIRGAYAEAWLWAIWPYLLWTVDGLARRRRSTTLVALAVGGALLAASFWTQAGLTLLFLPLLVTYGLLTHMSRQAATHRPMGLTRPWLAAGSLALVSILALVAVQAATGGLGPVSDSFSSQFLYPFQLFVDARGEGLSFQLGTVAVGLSIVTLALGVSRRDPAPSSPGDLRPLLWFFAGVLLIMLGLTLPLSAPLWRATGLDGLVAQPWQVLALAGLPLVFVAGAVVQMAPRLADLPALTGLLALVILASYPRLAPDFTSVDPGLEPVAAFRLLDTDQASSEVATPQALLLDYAVRPPTELEPTLALTLTWQAVALPQQAVALPQRALAPVDQDYTVFVHLLDGAGRKVAQRDSQPCGGACPTSSWQPGQIYLDRYTLDLPAEAPPGPYRLAAGLYLIDSGERAIVLGLDDRTVYLDVP